VFVRCQSVRTDNAAILSRKEVTISRVALVRGEDRYSNISRALEQIAADVDLSEKQRVLIKPNFVVTDKALAVTHAEAMRAVLDFVRARYDGPLTIAKGLSTRPAVSPRACSHLGRPAQDPRRGDCDAVATESVGCIPRWPLLLLTLLVYGSAMTEIRFPWGHLLYPLQK